MGATFFGVLGGTVPVREFFNPLNLIRLVGLRGPLPRQATTAG